MMVYRGPQLVQLVKAYPYRRLPGSVQSARHSAHVAMSGETSANLPVSATLGRMRNSRSPLQGQGSDRAILNPGQRRMLALQRLPGKPRSPPPSPSTSSDQAGRVIQHIPREAQPLRQMVHERPEPDALHDPPQPDLNALWHRIEETISRR